MSLLEALERAGFDMDFTRGIMGAPKPGVGYKTGPQIAGKAVNEALLQQGYQLPRTADIFGAVPDQYFQPETKIGAGINQLLRGAAQTGQFVGDALVRAPLQSAINVGRMYDTAGRAIGEYATQPTDELQSRIIADAATETDQFRRASTPRTLSSPIKFDPQQIDDELSSIAASLRQPIKRQTPQERADMEDSEVVGVELTGLPSGTRGSGDFLPDAVTPEGEAGATTETNTGAAADTASSAGSADLAGEPDEKKDGEPYNPYGALLDKAMAEVTALRGEDPNKKTRKEYMEEFAEATGINISGQPDKSHALMALGLSLMQNKAGKGFNVSKMLGALGEAGEAAMPAFQKAAETARAERVAAGKYALGEVKADAANRAAQLKAANERVTDLMTKTVDAQVKLDLEAIQHANDVELKIAELEKAAADKALEGQYDFKNVGTLEDKGLPGFKTRVGIRKTDGQSVYLNPEDEIGIFASALADVNEGVNSLDHMKDLIIGEAKKPGGTNVSRAKGFLEGVARSFKFDMDQVPIFEEVTRKNPETGEEETVEVFTGRYETEAPPAGALQTVDAIRDRVIAQFKRFLTQETGNGISNVDIQNIQNLLGKIDFGSDPALAIARIEEAKKIFLSKKGKLEARVAMYENKNRHRNDAAYQETMRIGREALSKAYNLDPAIFGGLETTKDEDGVEVIKLYQ